MAKYYLRRRLLRSDGADDYGLYRITRGYGGTRYEVVEDFYEPERGNSWILLVLALVLALAFLLISLREPGIGEEVEPGPEAGSYVQTISAATPMRVAPDERARVMFDLPLGLRMLSLAKSRPNARGEAWTKVRIETPGGLRVGWVNQRDIR